VFHRDIWIYSLEKRIQGLDNVVITDARFPNEIEAIVRMGGKIVRVKRGADPEWYLTAMNQNLTDPESIWMLHDNQESMEVRYPNVHVSEWAWIGHSDISATIENNGTVTDLHTKISKIVER
jgi:hypothetical protein